MRSGALRAAEALLDAGATPLPFAGEEPVLIQAVSRATEDPDADLRMLELLLKKRRPPCVNVDPNARGRHAIYSALQEALHMASLPKARALVESGARLDAWPGCSWSRSLKIFGEALPAESRAEGRDFLAEMARAARARAEAHNAGRSEICRALRAGARSRLLKDAVDLGRNLGAVPRQALDQAERALARLRADGERSVRPRPDPLAMCADARAEPRAPAAGSPFRGHLRADGPPPMSPLPPSPAPPPPSPTAPVQQLRPPPLRSCMLDAGNRGAATVAWHWAPVPLEEHRLHAPWCHADDEDLRRLAALVKAADSSLPPPPPPPSAERQKKRPRPNKLATEAEETARAYARGTVVVLPPPPPPEQNLAAEALKAQRALGRMWVPAARAASSYAAALAADRAANAALPEDAKKEAEAELKVAKRLEKAIEELERQGI